jgi:Protein of unknown function (DUF3553)
MNPIRVGTYVTHSMRPQWGVGKVFGQSAQHVLVGFSGLPEAERFKRLEWRVGLLEKAEVKSDPELDSWKVECDSTCHYLGATPKAKRVAKPKAPKVAADVKAGKEPVAAKDAKAPVKESKAPVKEAKTAAKEVKAPAKAAALKTAAKPAPKATAKVAAKPAAKAAKPAKPAKKKR